MITTKPTECPILENPMQSVPAELMHLIPGFVQRREVELAEILKNLEKNNFFAIRTTGHQLKGTGGGYGFPYITELGDELEQAAMRSDAGAIREIVEKLQRTTASIKSHLPPPESH